MEAHRFRRQAASALDACPEQPQGAEFAERQEFIVVGGEKKRDLAPPIFKRKTIGFKQPEIFDSRGDHAPKFLGFPRACFVIRPPIGEKEMPSQARIAQEFVHVRYAAPWGQNAGPREMPNRIIAEINIERSRSQTAVTRHRSKGGRNVERARPRIDTYRYEIRVDPSKRGIEIALRVDPYAKAACGMGLRNGEGERIGAANEV